MHKLYTRKSCSLRSPAIILNRDIRPEHVLVFHINPYGWRDALYIYSLQLIKPEQQNTLLGTAMRRTAFMSCT